MLKKSYILNFIIDAKFYVQCSNLDSRCTTRMVKTLFILLKFLSEIRRINTYFHHSTGAVMFYLESRYTFCSLCMSKNFMYQAGEVGAFITWFCDSKSILPCICFQKEHSLFIVVLYQVTCHALTFVNELNQCFLTRVPWNISALCKISGGSLRSCRLYINITTLFWNLKHQGSF
jgi:hypothetical protein